MGTVLLDTADLAEAEAFLSKAYAKVRLESRREIRTRTRIVRAELGSLIIDQGRFAYDAAYDAQPPEAICLCRVRNGVIEERLPGGETRQFGEGEVVAFGAHGVPFTGAIRYACCDIVSIERTLLDRTVAGAVGARVHRVELTDSRAVSTAAARHLGATIDYLRNSCEDMPPAVSSPLLDASVNQLFVAAVLAAFPNNAFGDSTAVDHQDATPALLRRAIAYIDDNAHTEISLADIAAAIGLTPRATQYMFRNHRDCTPMEYVRRVRLQHAHEDLAASDGTQTSVSHIARRWGFGHLGRFAASYREAYGCSPHITLCR